jgi:hypothetical protein
MCRRVTCDVRPCGRVASWLSGWAGLGCTIGCWLAIVLVFARLSADTYLVQLYELLPLVFIIISAIAGTGPITTLRMTS